MLVPPRSRMMMIAVLCRAATTCGTPAITTATADRSTGPDAGVARQWARPGGGDLGHVPTHLLLGADAVRFRSSRSPNFGAALSWRVSTARSWAAVTAVASSAGASRTASRIAVQLVGPPPGPPPADTASPESAGRTPGRGP